MLEKAEEIREWLGDTENDLKPLHDRMLDDQELWRGEMKWPADQVEPGKEVRKMTRNDARVLSDKVAGILLSAKLTVRVPLLYGYEQLGERNSKIEKALESMFNKADDTLRNRLYGPSLSVFAHQVTNRGWIAGLARVEVGEDEEVDPQIIPWEPMQTFFVVGTKGVYRAAHRRWVMEKELAEEYPDVNWLQENGKAQLELLDFWEWNEEKGEIYNSIIARREFLKEPTLQQAKRMPVFVVPCPGPMPASDSSGKRVNVEDWGESVFAANRKLFREANRLDTETLDVAIADAKRGIVLSGPGGVEMARAIDQTRGEDQVYGTDKQVRQEAVAERRLPAELHILRQSLEAAMERGGLARVSWGQLPGQLSGLAIAHLASQEETVVTPRVMAMAEAYKSVAYAWVDQLMETGAEFRVVVEVDKSGKKRMERIDKLVSRPVIEVKLEPKLVGKEVQAMAVANQLRQAPPGRMPLMSDETIWEEYITVSDPEGERNRILTEAAMSLPFIQLQKQAMAFRKRGMDDYAQIMEFMADRNFQQMMTALSPPPPPTSAIGGPEARMEQGFPQQGGIEQGMGGEMMGPERGPLPPPEAMSPNAMPTVEQAFNSGQVMPQGTLEEIERLANAGLLGPRGV